MSHTSNSARIMVVDDHPNTVHLLARMLQKLDPAIEVLTAYSGEEALEKADSQSIDILITDFMMPGMNGLELIEHLNRRMKLSRTILMTAYDTSGLEVSASRLGVQDYLVKPVQPERIHEILQNTLLNLGASPSAGAPKTDATRILIAANSRNRDHVIGGNPEGALLSRIQKLDSQLDFEELVEQTLLRTVDALHALNAFITIIQPDGSLFERAAYGNFPPKDGSSTVHTLSLHVAASCQGEIADKVDLFAQKERASISKSHSLIAVPLLGRREVIGVLILTHEQRGYFHSEHLELLQAIGAQAAMAIENAQLYDNEHKRVQELVALNRLSHHIGSFTSSTTLLDTFPSLVQSTLSYPIVTLWLNQVESNQVEQLKLRSYAPADDLERGDEESLGIVPYQAANEKRAVLVSGLVSNTPEGKLKTGHLLLKNQNSRSVAAVPIILKERLVGVLAVHSPKPGHIQESDRVVLETLASQIGSALERIRLYESAIRGQRRLAAVLNSAADAILVFDQEMRLQVTNPAGERLFTDFNAQVGKPLPHGNGYDEFISTLAKARNADLGLSAEVLWPDGRTFMISIAAVKESGWVVVFNDVSHFKALDQLKNEFIATATHDLKNPITTIMGFSGLVSRAGPLNQMQIEFIRHIQDASRHMNELVTNLLEMARMEMGIGLNLEELEINQLLAELEEEFRPQAGLKNHQLIFDLSNECLIVYGDEKRLQQVVRNLLGNAIKYTPDGGMIILRSQMNDGEVDVSIMDNGIGIPEEELTNLFQKFYRVRRKETNDIEGSGLGLAIVKSIVERHNGKIRVESALGRGSCFRFSLPRVAA